MIPKPKRKSKDSLNSGTIIHTDIITSTRRKRAFLTLVIAITLAVSVSITLGIGIGSVGTLNGYSSAADSYKHSLCVTKVLALSQRGVIRDVGGFNGAISECLQMNYAGSIYNDVLSSANQE